MNSIVSVTECFFNPWYRQPSSLNIEFVYTGSSIFTGSLYPPRFPIVSKWMWFAVGYTVIVYFWGIYKHGSLILCETLFCLSISSGKIGVFLNLVTRFTLLVLDIVFYLFVLYLSTLVPVFDIFYISGI